MSTVIEGLGIPFGGPARMDGKDTFRTYFSPRTALALDMHPDGGPLLFGHGTDRVVGFHPIGRWFVKKITAKGMWVRAVLDDGPFTATIAELAADGMLGFSAGSAEHAVEIAKDGQILNWPLFELSLTPTPANPLAIARLGTVTVRAAAVPMVRITGLPERDRRRFDRDARRPPSWLSVGVRPTD